MASVSITTTDDFSSSRPATRRPGRYGQVFGSVGSNDLPLRRLVLELLGPRIFSPCFAVCGQERAPRCYVDHISTDITVWLPPKAAPRRSEWTAVRARRAAVSLTEDGVIAADRIPGLATSCNARWTAVRIQRVRTDTTSTSEWTTAARRADWVGASRRSTTNRESWGGAPSIGAPLRIATDLTGRACKRTADCLTTDIISVGTPAGTTVL